MRGVGLGRSMGGLTTFQSFIFAELKRWGEYPMVCELGVGEG